MSPIPLRAIFLIALLLIPARHGRIPAPEPASDAPADFAVQQLAEGVFAVVRTEPTGLWFEANNAFIINDEDVVVVDANFSLSATRAVVAALKELTDKPVRYVINTHWHDDHITGNQVYRDAYPGVEFIAHASATEDMRTVGAANRRQSLESGPGFAQQLRELVEAGRGLSGAEITPEERAGYLATVELIDRFVAEAPEAPVIPPTLPVEHRLALDQGGRTIEVLHLGRGHSAADLVVHLPAEGIVITGDLVVWPVPLVGSTSHPAEYADAVSKLLALRPRILVPGHGPVMRDTAYVGLVHRLLTTIREQTEAAVARGETLEQARVSVDLSTVRDEITGHSMLRRILFDGYVTAPAVEAAYREATEAP